MDGAERYETVIIGGGQAGLAVGYHLQRLGREFVILEAGARVGDSWRSRWDSLHLFTPARHDGLPGWRFPAPAFSFPSRDQMADYLEAYARRFRFRVLTGVAVDGLSRDGDRYTVTAGGRRFDADNVVVATGAYERPTVPAFAARLDPAITQIHSADYRTPSQLRDGGVLVVGAGNSGAEIAIEAADAGHPTWLSGPSTGQIPFRMGGLPSRILLERLALRFLFHRVLTVRTPIGRRMRERVAARGTPLIRLRPADIAAAGVERTTARVAGVDGGLPVLDDGRVLDAANVVWCTGFHHDWSWIDLPGFDHDEPAHDRGVVDGEPGLYLVGLHFLYALSSAMIHGVGRDAEHVARHLAARARAGRAGRDALVGA